MRWSTGALAVVAVGAAGAGLWLGEGSSPSLALDAAAAACLAGLAGAVILRRFRWVQRLAGGLALTAVVVVLYVIGSAEATRAFNACVSRGPEVRAALERYHAAHQHYPAQLADLDMPDLPGRLLLRPDLLRYHVTDAGYSLSFSDWLVEHTASEAEPFHARK